MRSPDIQSLQARERRPKNEMRLIRVICAILALLPALAGGAQEHAQHVKASFIADVKTVKPGESFDVGVLFQIDPGWRIYWENPGESGSPTRVAIAPPEGVSVDPIRYPLPVEFDQRGGIKGYGYQDHVMLVARVHVPGNWPRAKPIQLEAQVSWLECKGACIPGKARLELVIETGIANVNDNSEVFATWQARLPLEGKDVAVPFHVEGSASDLTLHWTKPSKEVRVLPIAPDGVEVVSVAVDRHERTTRAQFKLRYLGGEKKPGAALGLLVTYDETDGQRRGVRLSIPFRTPGG
jgi:DsbC/DsbD-like thiol-disulfide interchange protein